MTEIVPVRIDKETLDSLDLFVTLGFLQEQERGHKGDDEERLEALKR